MAWAYIGGAAVGVIGNSLLNSGGSSGGGSGGGGSGGSYYVPQGLPTVDQGWQQSYANQQGVVGQTAANAQPGYQQSLQAMNGINYQPYQQAANQSGGMYGQQAGMAGQQSQQLQQGANQLMQTGFDPQNQLFQQTQQQLGDQVNAGQAQRGLGNSAVGGQEYNQAMSNFDINWQNAQLQRQQTALQGAGTASGQSAALGGVGAGYAQQAGVIPTSAQQYVAGQPGAAASTYQGQMNALSGMYGANMTQAIPYTNNGQGAQQASYANNAAQNAATTNMLTQAGSGLITSANTPGSWLNNMFSPSPSSSNISAADASGWGGSYNAGGSGSGYAF